MFPEMRRKQQQLTTEDCITILKKNTSGTLAITEDDTYPYAVPLSYVYDEGRIFFHSAKSGHKIEALKRNQMVSFCVIDQDQIVAESFTTYFRSVIAFGRIRILQDDTEKLLAIQRLAAKYSPAESPERTQAEIQKSWNALCLLEMTIDHLTGKEAIELVRKNKNLQ